MNQTGATHYEENLHRDVDRTRAAVQHMGRLCEDAVRRSVRALRHRDRQMAFSVILRDRRIDEMEVEIDRLCLEFLVRQQPAAGPLRMPTARFGSAWRWNGLATTPKASRARFSS